jgi:hypothetical protein
MESRVKRHEQAAAPRTYRICSEPSSIRSAARRRKTNSILTLTADYFLYLLHQLSAARRSSSPSPGDAARAFQLTKDTV